MKSLKQFLAEGEIASTAIKMGEPKLSWSPKENKFVVKPGRKIRAHHWKIGDVARNRGPNDPDSKSKDYSVKTNSEPVAQSSNPLGLKVKNGVVSYGKKNEMVESIPIERNDPPAVLVLRRKAIRLYPDNTKIALYYNQQLNKYFSVPYDTPTGSVIQAEEIEDE